MDDRDRAVVRAAWRGLRWVLGVVVTSGVTAALVVVWSRVPGMTLPPWIPALLSAVLGCGLPWWLLTRYVDRFKEREAVFKEHPDRFITVDVRVLPILFGKPVVLEARVINFGVRKVKVRADSPFVTVQGQEAETTLAQSEETLPPGAEFKVVAKIAWGAKGVSPGVAVPILWTWRIYVKDAEAGPERTRTVLPDPSSPLFLIHPSPSMPHGDGTA